MRIPIWQIDSFTANLFMGNPAAVCLLEEWLPDETLQAIAKENNLSETAFMKRIDQMLELRWFTPSQEVDLCGHATLAAAFVVFDHFGFHSDIVKFQSKSGLLTVTRKEDTLTLNFPSLPAIPCHHMDAVGIALGAKPLEIYKATDYMAVFQNQAQIRALQPDMTAVKALDARGVIATAPGDNVDFVSRFFAPGAGIPEDPVTGSAHCTMTPYWIDVLKKEELRARQLSERGGELVCSMKGDRVFISGQAVQFFHGEIQLQT